MTIDPKYFELIQADIDGEIDDSGKAELENFLAESEEGRAVYEELETLCHSLDNMPEVEPPQHLRHVLLNQAPVKAAPQPWGCSPPVWPLPSRWSTRARYRGALLTT